MNNMFVNSGAKLQPMFELTKYFVLKDVKENYKNC